MADRAGIMGPLPGEKLRSVPSAFGVRACECRMTFAGSLNKRDVNSSSFT